MSFSIRKSIRLGPFRFNLSKSGIGLSVGLPGFRIGKGPHGGYIHAGRNGLYYRTALGGKRNAPNENGGKLGIRTVSRPASLPAGVTEEIIESAEIWNMQDATASAVLDEINAARRRFRMAIIPGCLVGICTIILWRGTPTGAGATFILLTLMVSVFALIACLIWDRYRRVAVILYELDAEVERELRHLDNVFSTMQESIGIKVSERKTHGHDAKYNAGATTQIDMKKSFLRQYSPPGIRTNVSVWGMGVGRQVLFFMPDALLVYEGGQYGSVSYGSLEAHLSKISIIESNPPRDATIVGHTWQHPNKSGGPDKRFRDNPQIPIVHYEKIIFKSSSGLHEEVLFSGPGSTKSLDRILSHIAAFYAKGGSPSRRSAERFSDSDGSGKSTIPKVPSASHVKPQSAQYDDVPSFDL